MIIPIVLLSFALSLFITIVTVSQHIDELGDIKKHTLAIYILIASSVLCLIPSSMAIAFVLLFSRVFHIPVSI